MVGNIGTLAVIAILVAVIAPSVVRRVDRATWTRETADLQTIADSYTQCILTNKTIPGPNTWAASVASYMSLPVSSVTTNSRRFARAFLVDPALSISGSGLGTNYTQTSAGAAGVTNARVMILSSLARALPISTGVPSTNEFNAIWDTPEGGKPATSTWTSWAGTGDDLRIKRLNLEPRFHQLILVNRDAANTKWFSIDSTNTVPLASGSGTNRYYLDGTVVGLYTNANGIVQSRHLLKRSISFVFESGAWSDGSIPSQPASSGTGSDFVNHATTFFSSRTNPYPTAISAGASQESVIIAMYTFMFDYSLWANECPHFSDHGNGGSPASVPEYMLLDNQGANGGTVNTFSLNLDKTPSGSGSSP